ncbi:YceI family protein [Streptomyces sp. URMC 123]|uniref:YceI family protein n=1 Tax=Streptomyces sp. URMC 123 TaxID=3423403 RepID=UPI003F1C0651
MFGRWLRNRTGEGPGTTPLRGPAVPAGAGMLSCRVFDPVRQPLAGAEFVVSDAMGRKVMAGESDPFGSFVAAVPPGGYRLSVAAEGYVPFRAEAEVTEGGHTAVGDIALQIAPPPQLPEPGDWEVDPGHSTVRFTARHIGLARIHGRFNSFGGALRIAERMEDSLLHVVIDAASIDTAIRMRDDHLRSADFLDVKRFPTLEFYSDRFTHRGGSRWTVSGALTIHGVSRTVALDTQYLGVGHGMKGEQRAACTAVTELHREDFTLNWQHMLAQGIAAIGSSISVELDIQATVKS